MQTDGTVLSSVMQADGTVLSGVASLLWPLLFLVVLLLFRKPIAILLESARSRRFTLKIGGQELTMDEASEQQRTLIADLQMQVAEIMKRLEGASDLVDRDSAGEAIFQPTSILWVDDEPKNNSFFLDQLEQLGIRVDLALSTADGLSMFDQRRYSAVISDMSRREDGRTEARAGLKLLTAVRERDPVVRFIIFCGARSARINQEEALRIGADGITSSAAELYSLLNLDRVTRETVSS